MIPFPGHALSPPAWKLQESRAWCFHFCVFGTRHSPVAGLPQALAKWGNSREAGDSTRGLKKALSISSSCHSEISILCLSFRTPKALGTIKSCQHVSVQHRDFRYSVRCTTTRPLKQLLSAWIRFIMENVIIGHYWGHFKKYLFNIHSPAGLCTPGS